MDGVGKQEENIMKHDFQYISKRDSQVSDAYDDLMQILRKVRSELKKEFTFQHKVVGSYSRNMITYDKKGNTGFDFDVNICPNDNEGSFKAKDLKLKFKAALDKYSAEFSFSPAEDSTRVLTIKVKNKKHSRIVYSVDFCIVNDYTDDDGDAQQEYIRHNKNQKSYEWCQQPDGYYMLPEKIQWLKDNRLWQQVTELYITNKNNNNDEHIHSRTIFANTVHEVCQRNGY
jgi:hypothetical protein